MKIRSAVVALVATALTATAAPAHAVASQKTSAGTLGTWMAGHGDHIRGSYSDGDNTVYYDDYGLTIDAVLALDAAKVGQTEAKKATSFLKKHVADYIGDGTTETKAGETAKLLILSRAQGEGNAFGGINLRTRLEGTEASNGRFVTTSQFGDYSNTFSQSLAVIALKRAGGTVSAAAGQYLLTQQCPGGGFRVQVSDTPCAGSADSDSDATAIAMQGLLSLPSSSARTAALDAAFGYLYDRMEASGGISSGSGTPAVKPNANTTGLAVAVLRATGHGKTADRGREFLKSLRMTCSYAKAVRGVVAFDADRKADAKADGSKATMTDQDRRSTAQAVLGLAGVTYAKISKNDAAATSPKLAC